MSEGQLIDATTYLDEETVEEIKQQLEYGDTLSAWIRDACRQKLNREQEDN